MTIDVINPQTSFIRIHFSPLCSSFFIDFIYVAATKVFPLTNFKQEISQQQIFQHL